MPAVHPIIDEFWPHLGELVRTLDALDGRTVSAVKKETPAPNTQRQENEMFDRFVARLNRTGGPKLSPRAIAQ